MASINEHTDWIAVELGKSGLQAWLMRRNKPVAHRQQDDPTPKPAEPGTALLRLIGPWLSTPPTLALICGWAGAQSEIPGHPVPACPADFRAAPLALGDPRVHAFALPGLMQSRPPDIMTSDATRIAGFLALNNGWDGVICQPGPQTSWALVSAGEVVSFQTFLTVELVQMLANRLSLAGISDWDTEDFIDALDETLSRPEKLATALNTLRIGAPVQSLANGVARARLWGALIGVELAAARPYWLGQQIAVIGPPEITKPYYEALMHQGAPVLSAEDDQMTLAGLVLARSHITASGG